MSTHDLIASSGGGAGAGGAHVPPPIGLWSALAASTLLVLAALVYIATATPADVTLGIVQKIFYFHVGTAFAMLIALVAGAGLSAVDLVSPSERVDAAARAAIEVGVVFGAMVLVSGPLWARKSWGMYWTWEPRLTLTLLVVLLAVAVLILRELAPDSRTGRRVGAAMAVLAAPGSTLIHLAVKLWGGNHPSVLQGGGIQSPEMRVAFWLAVAALLSVAAVMWWLRFGALRIEQQIAALELEASALVLRATQKEKS